jgi:very-short-patch-repair endonuclease
MTVFICKFCNRETTNAGANKKHENRCKQNPNPTPVSQRQLDALKSREIKNQFMKARKLGLPMPSGTMTGKIGTFTGRKHSNETKDKISKSRIKYLSENPDKVPYKLNHYSKGPSYPERYWKKVFDKLKVDYTEQYQIHTYQLDFALIEQKIDIEIDGEQHYLDPKIIESDIRRNKYLEDLGWKIIRIRWSEYKRIIDKQEKLKYIDTIVKEIRIGTQVDKGN